MDEPISHNSNASDKLTYSFPNGLSFLDTFLRWVQDDIGGWYKNPLNPPAWKLLGNPKFRTRTHIISVCFIDSNSDHNGQFHSRDRVFFYEPPTPGTRRRGHTLESYARLYREIDMGLVESYDLVRITSQTRTFRCRRHRNHRYAVQVWCFESPEDSITDTVVETGRRLSINSSGITSPSHASYTQQFKRKRQISDGNLLRNHTAIGVSADCETDDYSHGHSQSEENEEISELKLAEQDPEKEIAKLGVKLRQIARKLWRSERQRLDEKGSRNPTCKTRHLPHRRTKTIARRRIRRSLQK